MVKRFIEHHKWFCRKSQHYILGNWSRYVDLFLFSGGINKIKLNYYRRFPSAYIKFMWLSRGDIFGPGV